MTGKSHRTIGYLRVSTGTQDLKKNRTEILAFANEKDVSSLSRKQHPAEQPGATERSRLYWMGSGPMIS